MRKISVNELRKAIKNAEPGNIKSFQPVRSKLEKNRKAAETILSRWMQDSGLDLDKLQALNQKREADLERLAAAHKKQALRQAKRKTNKAAIVAQAKAVADLAEQGVFPNPSFSLDTPFLIWSTPSLPIDSSAMPFGSWAKFRFLTSNGSGVQKVSFYFYWVNHFSDYAVITATTYLSADGYLRAHAPWSFHANISQVTASAWFGMSLGISSDLDPTDYVTQDLGWVTALDNPTSGDVESKTIDTGTNLSKTMFAVPPGDVTVFEVALAVEYENREAGNIEADFRTGSFLVWCPVVVVSLLNSPPGGPLV